MHLHSPVDCGIQRAAGALHRERDPEISDQRRTIMQENILRLDVAVNHVLAMRVVERARNVSLVTSGIT